MYSLFIYATADTLLSNWQACATNYGQVLINTTIYVVTITDRLK